MLDTAIYLCTADIARRSGVINSRYRTTDGRYILYDKDLARIQFTTDEYLNGLKGIEKITTDQALRLIKDNHSSLGEDTTPVEVETSGNQEGVNESEGESEDENGGDESESEVEEESETQENENTEE